MNSAKRFDSNLYNFKRNIYFLHQYWEIINNRGEHSEIQVFFATKFVFDFLRIEWEKITGMCKNYNIHVWQ